nr:restriction endonuclease subunit S [Turicibacter bilis]
MQQLLTKGIGHTEFKQTEIGEIPVSWEVNEIGTLIQVQGGYAFKSKDAVDSGVRWFKIANVSVGNIKWEDVSYLPTDYSEIYKDYLLKERDFVVALTRPILKNELKIAQINKSDIPALLNQRVGRIRYKKEVNPQFIYYVMTSKYYVDEINSRILGTDPPNVSPKQLESILIQIPSIEEQLEIVSILENVDTKIKREEDILFKLNKLKQGLMQQLLTGQVRVGSLC